MKALAVLFFALATLVLAACQTKPEIKYVPEAVFPKPPEILMREPGELVTLEKEVNSTPKQPSK